MMLAGMKSLQITRGDFVWVAAALPLAPVQFGTGDPWDHTKAILARIREPSIPDRGFNARRYGSLNETTCGNCKASRTAQLLWVRRIPCSRRIFRKNWRTRETIPRVRRRLISKHSPPPLNAGQSIVGRASLKGSPS